MLKITCPVCLGKCVNKVELNEKVNEVPCFTCRSKGYLYVPSTPPPPLVVVVELRGTK
jgi:hypothetical protein